MQTLRTRADLANAVADLTKRDTRLAEARARVGAPSFRRRKGGFEGLMEILVSQQISDAAAATIHGRLVDALPEISPAAFLTLTSETLSACGISRPKQRYLTALAEALVNGTLDLKALHRADDDTIRAQLTALPGIGPWSADIYLLFCLSRADCFPAGDLALQESYRMLYGKRKRPDAATLAKHAEAWRPYRAVAARLLWMFYRHARQ